MHTQDREHALLDIFRQGLQRQSEQLAQTLGDRTAYIGMSDIGRYAECPRAALAGKLCPQATSLEHLLALQRGHWFETGVGETLAALKIPFLAQLEIRHTWQDTPIRAHLDFTLVWDKPTPAVRILEVKSMTSIPEQPHAAHELQAQGQVGLLRELWHQPAFALRAPDSAPLFENLTFPQLCKECLGLTMPDTPEHVSLEAWLLCLSMKEARAFGPCICDTETLERVMETAHDFWADLKAIQDGSYSLADTAYAVGFHPLCTVCAYNADCPKFPGQEQPQWNAALAKLGALKASRSALDTEIKEMEAALKQAHQLSGLQDWINTGQYRFRTTTVAGRRTLNQSALQEELEAYCASGDFHIDVPALLQRHEHTGAPSTRLSVTPIHQ